METVGEVFYFTSPQPLYHQHSAENNFLYQFSDRPQQNWYDYESEEESSSSMNDDEEEEDFLERFLKKLDVKGHEMIKKLLASKNVPFEQVFKGKHASRILEKMQRKMGGEREKERGLDIGEILQEELKNERFKVKTMNIVGSGVVKEEERDNTNKY